MQNAKDTFYTMLQGRLAALNPARTIVMRGALRPGVLVEENELPSAAAPADAFRLRWAALSVDSSGPLPLVVMECTIEYATEGSAGNGGMDRGRALAAMDAELVAALAAEPRTVPKQSYAPPVGGSPVTTMGTYIFWADPVFGAASSVGERMERAATVQVFAYQEAGEL